MSLQAASPSAVAPPASTYRLADCASSQTTPVAPEKIATMLSDLNTDYKSVYTANVAMNKAIAKRNEFLPNLVRNPNYNTRGGTGVQWVVQQNQ